MSRKFLAVGIFSVLVALQSVAVALAATPSGNSQTIQMQGSVSVVSTQNSPQLRLKTQAKNGSQCFSDQRRTVSIYELFARYRCRICSVH